MSGLENKLIKKPHGKMAYDETFLYDIAKCAHPVTGPMYFLTNFFYIQHPIKGRIKYAPYEYQKKLIDQYINYKYSINLLSRQLGKCLVYSTMINRSTNIGDEIEIGTLLWKDLTIKQKIVTKLESWLVELAE